MKTLPVTCETVDVATGKVEKRETVKFGIMPPKPGTCSVCGVDHEPAMPHNAQSMYYQYAFYGEFGRWPTWADAVAHCTAEMQDYWKTELVRMGEWTAPDGEQIAQPYAKQEGARP
jgi:hypothetical protein